MSAQKSVKKIQEPQRKEVMNNQIFCKLNKSEGVMRHKR